MKKKFLSLIAAGLMLGGVSQIKAMDPAAFLYLNMQMQAQFQIHLTPLLNRLIHHMEQAVQEAQEKALLGHQLTVREGEGFFINQAMRDDVPGIQIAQVSARGANAFDDYVNDPGYANDPAGTLLAHFDLTPMRFIPFVKYHAGESPAHYYERIQAQKSSITRKYMAHLDSTLEHVRNKYANNEEEMI